MMSNEDSRNKSNQQLAWAPTVLRCCQPTAITVGSRILQVGVNADYPTAGNSGAGIEIGRVLGVKDSTRYVRALGNVSVTHHNLDSVEVHRCDLLAKPLSVYQLFDVAWIGWATCLVSAPATLVDYVASALRPGGIVIFHEYVDYEGWKVNPPSQIVVKFVESALGSWRNSRAEPEISKYLPSLLSQRGLEVWETSPCCCRFRIDAYDLQGPPAGTVLEVVAQKPS